MEPKWKLTSTEMRIIPWEPCTETMVSSNKNQNQGTLQASAAWNPLPAEVLVIKNTNTFKAVLKQHLLSTLV